MGAWQRFKRGWNEGVAEQKIKDAERQQVRSAATPRVGEDGVRMVAERTMNLKPYVLAVYDNRIETRKKYEAEKLVESVLLSSIVAVRLQTRWQAANTVTATTTAGEVAFDFFKRPEAEAFHRLLAAELAGRQ